MSRPISERTRDPWWWLEQFAHVAIGAISGAILWIGQPIAACGLAALWAAILREWEQRPVASWWDAIIDTLATVVGGLVIGLVIWGMT